jgi:hypothetical protein
MWSARRAVCRRVDSRVLGDVDEHRCLGVQQIPAAVVELGHDGIQQLHTGLGAGEGLTAGRDRTELVRPPISFAARRLVLRYASKGVPGLRYRPACVGPVPGRVEKVRRAAQGRQVPGTGRSSHR